MGLWVKGELNFNVPIPGGTGAAEVVTDYVPGFAFIVESVEAYWSIAATGTSASRVCNVLRTNDTTDTTVATATIVLADGATIGAKKAFTTVPHEFSASSKLSVTFDSGGTAFTAGTFNLKIVYRARVLDLAGT